MRILRLVDDDFALEFHPFVTVITGLDDKRRTLVRQAFQRSVEARATSLGGLIEAHGIVLDLDEASLELLDLGEVSADVVVEVDDLPGAGVSDLGRRLKAAERRLDALVQPRLDAERSIQLAEEAVASAQRLLDEARLREDEARAALDSAEAELGAHVAADVAAGQEREDGQGRRAETGADAEVEPELTRLRAELEQAEVRATELAGPAAAAAGAIDRARRALDTARSRSEAAETTRRDHEQKLDLLRSARDAAARRLDPEASGQLADAQRRLDLVIARLDDLTRPPADARGSTAGVVSAAAEAGESVGPDDGGDTRAHELRMAIALQESFDPEPLRAALDNALATSGSSLVPSPEAQRLAEQIETVVDELHSLEAVDEPSATDLEAAQRGADEARRTFERLEELARVPLTSDADRAEVVAAHTDVLAARDAVEKRFGRRRAEEKLAAAEAAEAEHLTRLGFSSYTDFLTRGPGGSLDADEADTLQLARLAALTAEAEHRDLLARRDATERRRTLSVDLDELRSRARAIIDRTVADDELIEALASVRVSDSSGDAIEPVMAELDRLGLDVRDLSLPDGEVVRIAQDWLAEFARAEERAAALAEELEELEELEAPNGMAPVAGSAGPEHDADVTSRGLEAELRHLEDEIGSALRRVDAHDDAAAEVMALEGELTALGSTDTDSDPSHDEVVEEDPVVVAAARLDEAVAEHDRVEAERKAAESDVVRLRTELAALSLSAPDGDAHGDGDDVDESEGNDGPDAAYEGIGRARDDAAATLERASRAVGEADAELGRTRDALEHAAAGLEGLRRQHDDAVAEMASLRQAMDEMTGQLAPLEEIEWYLLARLAAQRDVCFGGSVPLVIDRALDDIRELDLPHVLARLERMAGAVQVVHLTDDERIIEWAERAGERRVAVVAPIELSTA